MLSLKRLIWWLASMLWYVLIKPIVSANETFFNCGGSVINSRYVLTAARCISRSYRLNNDTVGVRIGDFDYSTRVDCQGDYDNMICESTIQDIDIAEYIIYEDYQRGGLYNYDIALLRLVKSINFRNNAAPVCLPVHKSLRTGSLVGRQATLAGWGRSTRLSKFEVPIISEDVCSPYYERIGGYRPENTFCGDFSKEFYGYHAGGALVMESGDDSTSRTVQVGILSYGGEKAPYVYTDVTKYMDWILDNIKE